MRIPYIAGAFFVFLGTPIYAQDAEMVRNLDASRRAHSECVMGSVAAQLEAMSVPARKKADISMLAEQGFVACATEERALMTVLQIYKATPRMVETVLLKNRLDTKRELQAIAADPDAYQKRQLR